MDNNHKALRMALIEMFVRGYIKVGEYANKVGFDEKQIIIEIEKEFIDNYTIGQVALDYFSKVAEKDISMIPELVEQRRKIIEKLFGKKEILKAV